MTVENMSNDFWPKETNEIEQLCKFFFFFSFVALKLSRITLLALKS